MTQDIEFSELSLKDAIDLAILVEDEAEERYREFVAQLEAHHTVESPDFFRFMAANEAKHGEELRKRRSELFGDEPSQVDGSMLWDVEAPEYAKARAFMSIQAALRVALEAEIKAYEFFDKALSQIKDKGVKELFSELREEEIEHQNLVKEQMAKYPADQGFDAEDFVDEPVGQ
ncbi:MAG: ferritin family protein [bacterium]|nr:ferritin family protein [bacterium]